MSQVTRQRAAEAVYSEKHHAVKGLLIQLDNLLDAHYGMQAKRPLDWGYVGDLAQVEERLKEVVGFLRPFDLEVEP